MSMGVTRLQALNAELWAKVTIPGVMGDSEESKRLWGAFKAIHDAVEEHVSLCDCKQSWDEVSDEILAQARRHNEGAKHGNQT